MRADAATRPIFRGRTKRRSWSTPFSEMAWMTLVRDVMAAVTSWHYLRLVFSSVQLQSTGTVVCFEPKIPLVASVK